MHSKGVEVVGLESAGPGGIWNTQGPEQEGRGLDLAGLCGPHLNNCLAEGKREK